MGPCQQRVVWAWFSSRMIHVSGEQALLVSQNRKNSDTGVLQRVNLLFLLQRVNLLLCLLQWSSKCTPAAGSPGMTWEHAGNTNSWAPTQTRRVRTPGVRHRNAVCKPSRRFWGPLKPGNQWPALSCHFPVTQKMMNELCSPGLGFNQLSTSGMQPNTARNMHNGAVVLHCKCRTVRGDYQWANQ